MVSSIKVEPIKKKRKNQEKEDTFNSVSNSTCTICTKIKYSSYKQAVKELRKEQKYGTRVKRVYHCPICKSFHLTSLSIEEL